MTENVIARSPRARHAAGFTLIEVLVVVAIIGVLAAILLPVFAAARDKARQANCASNEKQLALALLAYAHDYDDQVMPQTDNDAGDANCAECDPNPAHFVGWYDLLESSYVKSPGVLRCLSYGGPFPVPDGWGVPNRFMGSTYAISGILIGYYHAQLSLVRDPGAMMMIAETPGGITWFNTWGPGYTCADMLMWNGQMHQVQHQPGYDDWGDPALTARVTVACADGHVTAIPISNLNGGTDGPWKNVSCWNPAW